MYAIRSYYGVIAEENDIYQLGTPCLVDMSQESGLLPTRNFQEGRFGEYKNIDGTALKEVRQNNRITSYNVCYTKLLRMFMEPAGVFSKGLFPVSSRQVRSFRSLSAQSAIMVEENSPVMMSSMCFR